MGSSIRRLDNILKWVDHILHAGDISDQYVIEQLEQIAPVTSVSVNVDDFE